MAIDLATTKFWMFVAAGVLLLTPLIDMAARRALFAVINLAFLWEILDHRGFAAAIAGLAVLYILLQGAGRAGPRMAAVSAIFIGCGLLFVFHKAPWMAARINVGPLHAGRLAPVLTAIGYSYIFLRIIDAARSTWEDRSTPPTPSELVNYLTPFNMLAAGPIQAWDDFVIYWRVAEAPAALTFEQSLTFIERIVHGLFKKYVLAFAVKSVFITDGRAGGWYRLVEMNMDYVWLFLDFSAYSDIAVGIGGLMGVATPENFNKPYIARNITDFWERWHISLSLWIRRNLFFPIQIALVRRTQGKHALWCASVAIFISFTLCGMWHGLTLPFLWWGIANGAGLVIANVYRYWLKKRLGTKGVARYMASWPIRIAATVLTFEFVAFTIFLIATRWGGTS